MNEPLEIEVSEIHTVLRVEVDRMRERGADFNRKVLRFNDLAMQAVKTGSLNGEYNHRVALSAVQEVVACCDRNNSLFFIPGERVISYVQDWMKP